MGATTKIEWADATWNPIVGCSRISAGCRGCYAEQLAARFSKPGQPYHGFAIMGTDGPHWTGRVVLREDRLYLPGDWKRPKRIFVNSMADLFHESLEEVQIREVFRAMMHYPQHVYLVLTKRAVRMQEMLASAYWWNGIGERFRRHIWLGVSAENQYWLDARVQALLETPAALRFVSIEPLLDAVDIRPYFPQLCCPRCGEQPNPHGKGWEYTAPGWRHHHRYPIGRYPAGGRPGIDWVITGGHTGAGACPANPLWFYTIRDACVAAHVPYFHKQNGEYALAAETGERGIVYRNQAYTLHGGQAGGGSVYRFADGVVVRRVGRARAGRLLEGREWTQFPVKTTLFL